MYYYLHYYHPFLLLGYNFYKGKLYCFCVCFCGIRSEAKHPWNLLALQNSTCVLIITNYVKKIFSVLFNI